MYTFVFIYLAIFVTIEFNYVISVCKSFLTVEPIMLIIVYKFK